AALTGVSVVHMDVKGDSGDDIICVAGMRRWESPIGTLVTGLDIGSNAQLRLDLNGGDGNDLITVFYRGALFGFFEVDAHGAGDKDRVEAEITVKDGQTVANGEMDINLYGDRGDDYLGMKLDLVPGVQFTGGENPFIDGGDGWDTITMFSVLVD